MVLSQQVRCDVAGCEQEGLFDRQWFCAQYLGGRNRLTTIHVCPVCRQEFERLDTTDALKVLVPFKGNPPGWVR